MSPVLLDPRPQCRLAACAVAATLVLGGCSSVDSFLQGDKVDYRLGASKTRPLEIPPDLTQLARDPRYQPQGGVISAAATPTTNTAAIAAAQAVAPAAVGKVRVEKQGAQRWLVADAAPEVVFPEVRAFWVERGFTLTTDNAQAGVLETDWVENRAKWPNDFIRSTIGRVIDNIYDSGERDRYRVRVERSAEGTEIFLSHKGLEEVYVDDKQRDRTVWRTRPSDPSLEAEMLTRLLVRLGTRDETQARTTVASAPEQPARARTLGDAASLEVDEPFDRAWRRVGLALDRGGFTVEDRDRSAGIFFVRYIDPKVTALEDPGFFARLFGAKAVDKNPVRYRVALKGNGPKTTISVQTGQGAPEAGATGKTIVAQLVRDLR